VLRRLADDYLAVYGHRVLAVETFTDPARRRGRDHREDGRDPVARSGPRGVTCTTWIMGAVDGSLGADRMLEGVDADLADVNSFSENPALTRPDDWTARAE
jgi:hypothetical protein